MIKAITIPRECATREHQQRAAALLSAMGFAPGDGWQDRNSTGVSFLAPMGNLELVTGAMPSDADIYVEVSGLDDARRIAAKHGQVSDIRDTDWKSRLFTIEAAPGLKLAFWERSEPLRGKAVALAGDLIASGMKFAIVVARWNAVITDRLLAGAMDCLLRSGAARDDIRVIHVPGSWEIPAAARTLAEHKSVDAIVALGCLIRGETAHYEAIYNEVARGLGESQQATGVPHAFGVLTCETLEQALDRAGLKQGNKGFEAAAAAIEMASLARKLQQEQLQMAGSLLSKTGSRAKSRELALQMLYQAELAKQSPAQVEAVFWSSREDAGEATKSFAQDLFRVATTRAETIDSLIVANSKNWRLERMPAVDRNLLRMAIAEMLGFPRTPGPIIINEALEVAKRYCAPESMPFLNGVLDAVGRELKVPAVTGPRE